MKRAVFVILSVLFAVITAFCLSVYATEDSDRQRLFDEAGIIDDFEEENIESMLCGIRERLQIDAVIVTASSLDGMEPSSYADSFYDDNGFGVGQQRDGILLLRSLDPKYVYVSTCGDVRWYIPDSAADAMIDAMSESILSADYTGMCYDFTELIDLYMESAQSELPPEQEDLYDEELYGEDVFYGDFYGGFYDSTVVHISDGPQTCKLLIISLVLGVIISLISVFVMKGKHRTVRAKHGASDYIVQGSFRLTKSEDDFLYRNVQRTRRPSDTNNASHTGGTHAGGSHSGSSGSSGSHGGAGRSI